MILRVLFFLIPLAAWAQPAAAPSPAVPPPQALPPEQVLNKAIDYIRSNPQVLADVIRSAAAQLAAQQNPQAAPPPAAVAPPPAPAPPSVSLSPPPELMIAIWGLVGAIVLAATGAVAAWGKSHSETVQNNRIMQQVGINQDIDNAQKTQGGLVELALAKQGRSLTNVDASDPIVQGAAQTLRGRYPVWGPMTGLTQDIAAQKVLGAAVNQSVVPLVAPVPLVPASAVTVVQPAPPQLAVVEAAATPQQPPSPPAQGSIT